MKEKKTLTITHEVWGEVTNVKPTTRPNVWKKEGAIYCYDDGWREKVEEQWEESPMDNWGNISICRSLICGPNERLRVVDRYDLPEDWEQDWFRDNKSLTDYVQQYKKFCLILERKVVS